MSALKLAAWPEISGRATRFLAVLAGVLLIFMMGLIFVSVLMRYVAARPLLGVNEIVQLTAVAITMLALPYATHIQNHVRADLFDPMLGRIGRFVGDIATRLLSLWTLAYLIQRAWKKAFEAAEYGDATNMLNLPIWPLYGLVVLGIGLSMVVFVLQLGVLVATRRPMGELDDE